MVFPSIFFPLLLLSINSSGLNSATRLPGFPTDSYFQFAIAIPFIQGALFSAMSAGTNVANDIETGFLNRLSLTPLRRVSLMLGQLTGILALGMIQAAHVPAGRRRVRRRARRRVGRRAGADPALADHLARVRLHRRVRRAPDRQRRGRAGRVPALLRRAVPVLDVAAAKPDRDRLVPHGRHVQSRLVHARGDPLAVHHRVGLARRWRSASPVRAGSPRSPSRPRPWRSGPGWCAREPRHVHAPSRARSRGATCTTGSRTRR